MNDISISEVLTNVPEGLAVENRRSRLTALLGLAVAQLVQVPGAPLEGSNRTAYFGENTEATRALLFRFNEVVPFSVDRAMDIAYQVWNLRYRLVHECTADLLLGNMAVSLSLGQIVPEFEALGITPACVNQVTQLIKTHTA